MSQRRVWTILAAFVLILSTPRTGSAGIGEWIWEMSGPSMVGGGLECKFSLTGALEQCYVFVTAPGIRSEQSGRRFRVSLEGGAYISLWKNAGSVDYEFGKTYMLAFDPMLEFVTWDNRNDKRRKELYHGVMGASYNFLLGSGFRRFTNVAFKLRPIGYRYRGVTFEYNLRIYPNGFTSDEFGQLPVDVTDNKPETTQSFGVGIALGKN